MPKIVEKTSEVDADATDTTRPYRHHGVDLTEKGDQANGPCPFCRGRFTVHLDDGLWRCWSCALTGNQLTFLRTLHEHGKRDTAGWLDKLAADRSLLGADGLADWGVVRSPVDGAWLVPGYSVVDGGQRLDQLYRRVQVKETDGSWTWKLLPTPGVWPEGRAHALHMAGGYDPARPRVDVFEGPWDGVVWWEVAQRCKCGPDGTLVPTGDRRQSLVSDTNVVAVPGCQVWRDDWTELCRGKVVTLYYDNDHKDRGGRLVTAGADGAKRVAGLLAGVASQVRWLCWGGGGFDSSLPSGFDVRDFLVKGVDVA